MPQPVDVEPAIIVVSGASGNLTRRKLVPALYDLFLDRWLPEQFAVVGVSRTEMSADQFCEPLRSGVDKFSRRCKSNDPDWIIFAPHLTYLTADPTVKETPAGTWGLEAAEILIGQDRHSWLQPTAAPENEEGCEE